MLKALRGGIDAVRAGREIDEDVVAGSGGEGGLMEACRGLRKFDLGVGDG
jgi:hypothetical protein